MFSKILTKKSTQDYFKIFNTIIEADCVVIGAGSGLSTSAGFTYSGQRFDLYFSDFKKTYGIQDMYSGGFYPYPDLETYWAFWSRYIWINRYMDVPKDTYSSLLKLVQDKDYFVLTTNVDHCFQKAGFDKKRLFYTQGDYGLFQCSTPCHNQTFDNKEIIYKMLISQGFTIDEKEYLIPSEFVKMKISSDLIPYCPHCGKAMTMNLRADDTFVEDEGWHEASMRYAQFIQRHQELKIVYLELGVGYNTPVIIKYPFWRMTAHNSQATYICINKNESMVPSEIKRQSICINGDIDEILNAEH